MSSWTEIKAIQCPKCGSTEHTEIRPDYFRCSSCGTEYFLDNGLRANNAVQAAPRQAANTHPAQAGSKVKGCFLFFLIVGLVIVIVSFIIYLDASSDSSPAADTGSRNNGYNWESSWNGHLYLSADGRPVILTLGTKVYYGHSGKDVDYISFTDVTNGQEIKSIRMPGNDLMTHAHGHSDFDVKEFSNGDIYILSDNTVVCRVRKTAYAVTDVTKTLFEGQPELVSGIAKIEFVSEYPGEGFNLFTNDGKNFFYFPLTNKLVTKETLNQSRPVKTPQPGDIRKTGFDFSQQCNYDYPEVSAQLYIYSYMGNKNEPKNRSPVYSGFRWTEPSDLTNNRILSHDDFTPGRIYFAQGLLYYDDDYVLISYRLNPGKNALRYVQCLNAHTAAIVFTTRLDEDYPPDECIRYKDGFAMSEAMNAYSLSLTGKLSKYIPIMYKTN